MATWQPQLLVIHMALPVEMRTVLASVELRQ
jgi:hypothetical protein